MYVIVILNINIIKAEKTHVENPGLYVQKVDANTSTPDPNKETVELSTELAVKQDVFEDFRLWYYDGADFVPIDYDQLVPEMNISSCSSEIDNITMQIKADIVGNFIVSVKAKDSSDIIGAFNLKCDVEPGLYYGTTDSDPSNEKVHLSNTLTVNLNSERTVRMWLYDGTRYSEVVSDDLSALAGLEIKGVNETAGGKSVNKVSFYSEIAGDYSVQYKNNNNYSISVNISLPSIGLYAIRWKRYC